MKMILEVLNNIDHLRFEQQPEEGALYAQKIQSSDYRLDPQDTQITNYNKLRALKSCKFYENTNDFYLIHEACIVDSCLINSCLVNPCLVNQKSESKKLFVENGALYLPCCDGVLQVLKIQRPSKKILQASEFIKGFIPKKFTSP